MNAATLLNFIVTAIFISSTVIGQAWNLSSIINRKSPVTRGVQITKNIDLYLNIPFDELKRLNPKIGASTVGAKWRQREITEEWVKEFENDIDLEYEKFSRECSDVDQHFSVYLGEIFLGKLDNEYYVLDGQHRYAAFEKFFDSKKGKVSFSVPYKLQNFISGEEMNQCFNKINKYRPIANDNKESLFKPPRAILIDHLSTNYGQHISQSERCQFPNVHVDTIVVELMKRLGDNTDAQQLIANFETLNANLGYTLKGDKLYEKEYSKALAKQGLFVGALTKKSIFEQKRKEIPKAVRMRLFMSTFGSGLAWGKCDACKCKVTMHDLQTEVDGERCLPFHAAHVISFKNKGTNDISNLRVTCAPCNLSMGTQNLDEFKQMYYGSLHSMS